jgi:RNA polymerase sigma-70 factor (ECF subfamily)
MELAHPHPYAEATSHLVTRCVAGEDAAWRDLYERYYPMAATVLRRLGVRDPHVEDACQDVFLDVFRYLGTFRGEADLRTWLYRICVTHARKARQKAKVTRLVSWVFAQETQEATGNQLAEHDLAQRVQRALDSLAEHERVVFVLFELEGVPGKRIAEILECPETTVWRRLHYARERFKEAVEKHEGRSA